MDKKQALASALKTRFVDIATQSTKEMTAAANEYFQDEQRIQGLPSVNGQEDRDKLLNLARHAFDGVMKQVEGVVNR